MQGCVNGTCVSPGVCQCHFGFVGENCSSQCRCNKHSNCKGITQLDKCLECHNHTKVLQVFSYIAGFFPYLSHHIYKQGDGFLKCGSLTCSIISLSFTQGQHCEKCKPLYVGSAVGGGVCRPCREFCRGNSDICLSRDELKLALDYPKDHPLDPEEVSLLSLFLFPPFSDSYCCCNSVICPFQIKNWVTEGPSEDNAVCVNCQNNSVGDKCESCLSGYFLLQGKCEK